MKVLRRIAIVAVASILVVVAIGVIALYVEGHKAADRSGEYVALGSSFAAGPMLDERVPGSPHACWQTLGNYPHQLAQRIGLRLVDVSCGGATTEHLLRGGPLFQRAQIESVGPSAKLVTITIGGNDVDYARDLGVLAYRSRQGFLGWLLRAVWNGPRPADARPFEKLETRLEDLVRAVRKAAPQAAVALVTYPDVLPKAGTCAAIELSESEATLMRSVADELADTTRHAATASGAQLVDVASASEGHDACSATPWVNGGAPADGAMFHPNKTGAAAIAALVASQLHARSAAGASVN